MELFILVLISAIGIGGSAYAAYSAVTEGRAYRKYLAAKGCITATSSMTHPPMPPLPPVHDPKLLAEWRVANEWLREVPMNSPEFIWLCKKCVELRKQLNAEAQCPN